MTKSISNITKDRLKEAVSDMAILTDDGLHPTNALAKVAQSLSLTDDQTRLVGRAYNTAHTADIREKGAGILEKLATTPIADCEEAIAKITQEKTATVNTAAIADVYNSDIDISQYKGLSKIAQEEIAFGELQKTASTKEVKETTKTAKKLLNDQEFLQSELKKLAAHAAFVKEKLEGKYAAIKKVASDIDKNTLIATKIAATQRSIKANVLLPAVETSSIKLAAADTKLLQKLAEIDETSAELKETIVTINKVAQCLSEIDDQLKKKIAAANPSPPTLPPSNQPPVEPKDKPKLPANTDTGDSMAEQMKHFLSERLGGGIMSAIGGSSTLPAPSNSIGGARVSIPSRYVQYGIVTPTQQRALDSIRLKSIVNDMMSNDDVISQYDAEDVYRVFNELNDSAPDAMSRPMVARSFVREALAKGGILGSYDLNPLMTYDKDIARSRPLAARSPITTLEFKKEVDPVKKPSSESKDSKKKK